MKPFYIIATILALFLLGDIAFNSYVSAASSIQIANAAKPRHIILDRNGMIRLRVYLNDLLKKGL